MFILISLFLLFPTIVQCQNLMNNPSDSKSIVQSTCFKDISIFKSNSPHVIQKKDDMICVDHERS